MTIYFLFPIFLVRVISVRSDEYSVDKTRLWLIRLEIYYRCIEIPVCVGIIRCTHVYYIRYDIQVMYVYIFTDLYYRTRIINTRWLACVYVKDRVRRYWNLCRLWNIKKRIYIKNDTRPHLAVRFELILKFRNIFKSIYLPVWAHNLNAVERNDYYDGNQKICPSSVTVFIFESDQGYRPLVSRFKRQDWH